MPSPKENGYKDIKKNVLNTFFFMTLTTFAPLTGSGRQEIASLAPGVGLEPTTNWLTANCSTTELPGIINEFSIYRFSISK